MGYTLTTLKNLPEHLGYYFFIVGDYENKSPINDFFRDDFKQLAGRLGEVAAVIEQARNSRMAEELTEIIRKKHYITGTKISKLLDNLQSEYPGLLITKAHPSSLTEKDGILYIPFSTLDEVYKDRSNELLRDLVTFCKGKDDLIKAVSKGRRMVKKIISGVDVGLNLGFFSINWSLDSIVSD